MAGYVYEVACKGSAWGVPYANIFHVWDGDESETSSDIADVFENNYLTDIIAKQTDHLTYTRIEVNALDALNPAAPYSRVISKQGTSTGDVAVNGAHLWVKFISDDSGYKSGGKLIGGLTDILLTDNSVKTADMTAFQTIFDDLVTDLVAAGLALAIYRPSLSLPGLPQISICSVTQCRGIGTNNRRQVPFQI